MDPDQEAFYFNIYQQRGGAGHNFKGARYIQYGSGFGDVLRSTARHMFSVARTEATAKMAESVPKVITAKRQNGTGKRRKKKRVLLNKTIVYKAPQKKRKRRKKSSKKTKNSKLPKFNF